VEPETAPRREYEQHTSGEAVDNQDVYLDVPNLSVESLDLEVSDLRARVSLQAEVLNLLRLNVGVDAVLGQVRLDVRNVEAQALLKVRLDKVAEILNRVLATIDSNPEIIEPLARASMAALEQAGTGVRQTLGVVGNRADEVLARTAQDVDQLSRGVRDQVTAGQAERELREPGEVRRAPAAGPAPIDASARVAAETAEGGAGGERPQDEQRPYRGLPRRAERG
jgi:hypothetical protein